MGEDIGTVRIGQPVEDFELTVYDPEKHDFGKVRSADFRKEGKWLILFFYPADFTFV